MLPNSPKKKSDEQIHLDAWKAMHRHEWLFPQNFDFVDEATKKEVVGPTNSEEYLSYFARRNRLFMFRCPVAYKLPFLEKYREKVAFSSHMMQGPVVIPYTILQLEDETKHAIVDWMWDTKKEEFVFPTTLFATNQLDYIRFVDENTDLECEVDRDTPLGFNGGR